MQSTRSSPLQAEFLTPRKFKILVEVISSINKKVNARMEREFSLRKRLISHLNRQVSVLDAVISEKCQRFIGSGRNSFRFMSGVQPQ